MKRVVREGDLNRLGGGKGVTRELSGRKGLQRTANAKNLRKSMSSLLEEEPERQRGCKTASESNGAGMREVRGSPDPVGLVGHCRGFGFYPR